VPQAWNNPINDEIVNLLEANKHNAWMLIFPLAFIEACPGIGLMISGAILLAVAVFLYSEQVLTLTQMLPLAFAGACLSDHLGFYLGRWLGDKLHNTAFAKKRASQLQKAEHFILKHGTGAIVLGRLVPAVRSLVPMLAGVSGTGRLKFSLIDLLACAVWTAGLGVLVVSLGNLVPE
jgi:membrane-associated protein